MGGWRLVAVAAATLISLPAAADCRLALSLALDVSGSVDRAEYDLQFSGLARALTAPEVAQAFLAMPGAWVRLQVFEWSGTETQTTILDWTEVRSAADLTALAARINGHRRQPRQPQTAVGVAMLHGAALLADQGACWRRVLDISGDGKSNTGPRPLTLKGDPRLSGITINALAIGTATPALAVVRENSIAELSAWFRAEVIRGQDAFVQVALGYADFQAAMERKLLKELQSLPISALP